MGGHRTINREGSQPQGRQRAPQQRQEETHHATTQPGIGHAPTGPSSWAPPSTGGAQETPLSPAHRDLFPLLERQIPTREPSKHERWHTATFSKPPAACRLGRVDSQRSVLTAQAPRLSHTKQPLHIPTKRGLPRRLHRRPACQLRHPPHPPIPRDPVWGPNKGTKTPTKPHQKHFRILRPAVGANLQ